MLNEGRQHVSHVTISKKYSDHISQIAFASKDANSRNHEFLRDRSQVEDIN